MTNTAKKQEPSRNAVLYARVSTQEQATSGASIGAQLAAMKAYCAMRGLTNVEVIIDPAVSAAKPLSSRPGGAALLAMVGAGTVDSVVAFKLDRLFRSCRDCLEVTAEWDKKAVSLHLVDLGGQALDTSTAIGRFFLTMIAGAAEFERNLIAERTTAALAHRKAQGYRVGQVPYGFEVLAGTLKLTPNLPEQLVLGRIHALRAEGVAIRAIADILNAEHVVARGTRWHATTIARLLRRPPVAFEAPLLLKPTEPPNEPQHPDHDSLARTSTRTLARARARTRDAFGLLRTGAPVLVCRPKTRLGEGHYAARAGAAG